MPKYTEEDWALYALIFRAPIANTKLSPPYTSTVNVADFERNDIELRKVPLKNLSEKKVQEGEQ